jgi:hypothetical protein
MSYQKKTLLLIAIATVLRLIITSAFELSNAEVYYWALAQKLQWNYFDHPPMVAWLIRLTTANLMLHTELFVRLGAVITSAICTWLMFKIGAVINNSKTGWFAALLYTCSIYGSIVAGTSILPDSPQMVFWLSGIFFLIKILRSSTYNQRSNMLWCLFGLMSGLCIMSKVHGVFLWFGVALYVVFIDRNWLKYRGIYLSALITLIIISPIIIWNVQNDFVTYKFHSSRVSLAGSGVHFGVFIKELLEEVYICNPFNFFLFYSSLLSIIKGKILVEKKNIQILLFCSLPLIAILLFISLFREILPHWTGPAYTCLLILPAIKLASAPKNKARMVPNIIKAALVYAIIIGVAEVLVVNYFPGTLSDQKQGINIGKGDVTLDMYGWKEAGRKFDSLYRSDVAKKIMPTGSPIVVTNWYPAAHIDFYIAYQTNQQTIGIGDILSLHQYYWMNQYKKPLKDGDSAYFIVPSDLFNYSAFDEVINNFKTFEEVLVIPEFRGGIICKELHVFRVKGYKGYTKQTSLYKSLIMSDKK